jgi:AcrR family transcriptional regulator
VDAARKLLEREGPSALSLRAVAREAGVSPAAPYHHFKDKGELLAAVAQLGWLMLNEALTAAKAKSPSPRARMADLGVAYVMFSRQHPALYRVMYDSFRENEALPDRLSESESAFCRVRDSLIEGGADRSDWVGIELAAIAAWCASHGLAEMVGFTQFERLKEAMGGEEAFLHGVFEHLKVYANVTRVPAGASAKPPAQEM